VAKKASAKPKMSAGQDLLARIKARGEKGVIGLEGFVKQHERYSSEPPMYLAVRIDGMEMDGCTPKLHVTLTAGRGGFFLASPCQFIRSMEEIDRLEAAREKANVLKKDIAFLDGRHNSLVSHRTANLVSYIVDKVPGAFEHPTIKTELEFDQLNPENPRLLSKHLVKYGKLALEIVHGTADPDKIAPESDDEDD
jgi:hypothetical protein